MQQGSGPERHDVVVSRPWTRRALLGLLPAGLWSATRKQHKAEPLPSAGEFYRFADPTTETLVVRLTTPSYASILPAPDRRFVLLKPRLLFCSSDRAGGQFAPFEIDLRTGAMRQIAEPEALDPASLSLDGQGKGLYFLDGGRLKQVAITTKRETRFAQPEVLAEDVAAFSIGASKSELFAIRRGQLQRLPAADASLLAENAGSPCLARPGGAGCLFGRRSATGEQEFWYASAASKPVLLASGPIRNPYWSADGHSLLFLRDVPVKTVSLSQLREISPEERVERCVAATSQFASFAPNGNDSVFVGASRSKAQPNIVLMLRNPPREMTLCEHRASQPAEAHPNFSPDSRRVYFQSDREGRPAIYSVNVEQLVEPT
jgi:oligogalacturonide lyase